MARLEAVPISLKEANTVVLNFHRHNRPTTGGKFAIGASAGGALVAVAIVGRPVARALDNGTTAEVLRVCSMPNAPRNVNSFLYGRCWRAWRAMGGRKIVTYTLAAESGASLRGAGWRVIAEVPPRPTGWDCVSRPREWYPIYGQLKLRWERAL